MTDDFVIPENKKRRFGSFTFKGENCVAIFETEEVWTFATMKFLDLKEIKDLKKLPSEMCVYEGEITPEQFLSKEKVKV